MRSIYLKKHKVNRKCWNCGGTPEECLRKQACLGNETEVSCPSCGGPHIIRPVGYTVGGKSIYSCKDEWHTRLDEKGLYRWQR